MEGILDSYKLSSTSIKFITVSKGICNMGNKIYIKLPSFMKRTLESSKEFILILRNFFYNNPIYTMDKYFNHNTIS